MATTNHKAYAAVATALSTELNSIANAASSAAGAAIDNSTSLELFMDVELALAAMATARATGAVIELWMTVALDGSTYGSAVRNVAELVAVFPLDAATAASRVTRRDIPIPPTLFKVFAYNGTGQTIASSGNTVTYRTHSITTA